MEITIRQATPSDWETIQRLNYEVFVDNEKYDTHLNIRWPFSNEGLAHYKKAVSAPDHCTFIAFDGDIPVGHIVVGPKELSYRAVKTAEILEIGVTPTHRSKGVGAQLVHAVRAWCRERGYQTVMVNSYIANEKAIAFYKRCGLVPIDVNLETDV